jgi:CheY-like chemotaxis protein/HPt (histidine-containing phosphotransfer) domain-containing protein
VPAAPADHPRWETARILVAEDNVTNQQVVRGLLRKLGLLRVDVVANGAEAVRALSEAPYDLVLMDVQMPVLDGLEATQQIRSPESRVLDRRVPVIALTAYALREDRQRCLDAGMDDYLSKPVDARGLREVLDRWLSEVPRLSEAELPIFDRAGLRERMQGSEELVRSVLDALAEDLPRRRAAIRVAFEAGDLGHLTREAHSIKGASASAGCERLRRTAASIEELAHQGDLGAAGAWLPELYERIDEALQAIR